MYSCCALYTQQQQLLRRIKIKRDVVYPSTRTYSDWRALDICFAGLGGHTSVMETYNCPTVARLYPKQRTLYGASYILDILDKCMAIANKTLPSAYFYRYFSKKNKQANVEMENELL